MMSVFLTFISLVSWAWSICETECEPVSSLLSDCSLPPISSAWADTVPEERNVTGLSHVLSHGPTTRFIANYSQAECFCVDARTEFSTCISCWRSEIGDIFENFKELEKVQHIEFDCREFGYYNDANLSYPSTTLLSSVPFETEYPSADEGDALCGEMCAPLRAHIEECNLTSIGADDWPDKPLFPGGRPFYKHFAAALLNRTASECLCTLQVLRSTAGCLRCLTVKEDENAMPNLKWRVKQYEDECHDYGYWTDSEVILPSHDEFYDDEPTGSLTSTLHAPSPTDDSSVGGRVCRSIGFIALTVLASLLSQS